MAQLGHFQTTVQDSSGNALSGVSVTVYREGATFVSGSGTSPVTLTVRNNGKIEAGDTVFINTDTATTYTVDSTTDTTVVLSGFSGTLSPTALDRIVPSNSPPTLYSDKIAGATKTNPQTTDSTGQADAYVEGGKYDVLISGGSAVTELRQHDVPGWFFPVSATRSADGTTVTVEFDATINAGSGSQGLRLMRDAEVRPIAISFGTAGTVEWETGLDAITDDYVLAYDPERPGDVFRGRKGSHWNIGDITGQPTTGYRLALLSTAADVNPTALLRLETVTGSSVVNYAKGALDDVDNFQISKAGLIGAGKAIAGYIAGGSEFATALTVQRTDDSPAIRLRRDGTATVQFEMLIDTTTTPANNFVIQEVSTGFNCLSIQTGTPSNSFLLRSNGSVSIKGTAAEIHSGAGTPEAAVVAPIGSIFMRTDGGANTTLYVKESGVGNTGWIGK